jgi:hypothetical protein
VLTSATLAAVRSQRKNRSSIERSLFVFHASSGEEAIEQEEGCEEEER